MSIAIGIVLGVVSLYLYAIFGGLTYRWWYGNERHECPAGEGEACFLGVIWPITWLLYVLWELVAKPVWLVATLFAGESR